MTVRSAATRQTSGWLVGAAVLGTLAAGALVAVNAPVAVAAAVVACALCIGSVFARRLPYWFLGALWALLLVYAVLGKGGANIGVGGIYVGELVLAVGLLAATVGGAWRTLPYRSPLAWGLVAFGVWGALRTAPYVGAYGIDALRDAVVWGYGVYAILVAGALSRTGWTRRVVERYGAWLLWFPVWIPVMWALVRYVREALPTAPGSDVPLVVFKAGDAAFHLMGVAAFVLLGLHRDAGGARRRLAPGGWVWWTAWFVAFALTGAASRAAILAILLGGAAVLALRPATRLWRPALTTLALSAVFFASGIRVEVREGRFLSGSEMVANLASVGGARAPGNRDATREWRLRWWRTIVDYTVHGPYFWTGKGYGINLAEADGFVVGNRDRRPLRSPHNGHLTILARSGVPGAVLWLLLQGGFALSLLRAYRRSVRAGTDWWARVNLWILACWTTFIVNAAFEVSLEGPHGGIWFWSVFGFGIAALELQRREAAWRRQHVGEAGPLRPAPDVHARAAG